MNDLPVRSPAMKPTPANTQGDTSPNSIRGDSVFKIGDLVSNRYEVLRGIGHGGMGDLFAVFDRHREQEIAIRVMRL